MPFFDEMYQRILQSAPNIPPATTSESDAFSAGVQKAIMDKQKTLAELLGNNSVQSNNLGSVLAYPAELARQAMQPYYSPSPPSPAAALAMGPEYTANAINNRMAQTLSSNQGGAVSGPVQGVQSPRYTKGVRSSSELWDDDIREALAKSVIGSLDRYENALLKNELEKSILELRRNEDENRYYLDTAKTLNTYGLMNAMSKDDFERKKLLDDYKSFNRNLGILVYNDGENKLYYNSTAKVITRMGPDGVSFQPLFNDDGSGAGLSGQAAENMWRLQQTPSGDYIAINLRTKDIKHITPKTLFVSLKDEEKPAIPPEVYDALQTISSTTDATEINKSLDQLYQYIRMFGLSNNAGPIMTTLLLTFGDSIQNLKNFYTRLGNIQHLVKSDKKEVLSSLQNSVKGIIDTYESTVNMSFGSGVNGYQDTELTPNMFQFINSIPARTGQLGVPQVNAPANNGYGINPISPPPDSQEQNPVIPLVGTPLGSNVPSSFSRPLEKLFSFLSGDM